MSKRVKIVLNRSGVREILRSSEMQDICTEYAQGVLGRVGDGYELTEHTGKNRVNAQVAATSYQAKRDNAKNNTLLKALWG